MFFSKVRLVKYASILLIFQIMCKTFHNEWEQKMWTYDLSLGGLSELITQRCTHIFIKKQNTSITWKEIKGKVDICTNRELKVT